MVIPKGNPHGLLEANAPQCPRCKTAMKVRKHMPIRGGKFDDVDYCCEERGAEVLRAMPHER